MTLRLSVSLVALAAVLAAARPSAAAQLHLEPLLLELNAPTAAGVITVRNEKDQPVTVQSRMFRWSQIDGADHLTATDEVVASPPVVKLAPGADYTVRIVRATKRPVAGEESYRILVDELPEAAPGSESGVSILVRQSVPVFFRARHVGAPDVRWSVHIEKGDLLIIADNHGDTRLRIAALRLSDPDGITLQFGHGLNGYALGRSSIVFTAPLPSTGFGPGNLIAITADTNHGPIVAAAAMPTRQ